MLMGEECRPARARSRVRDVTAPVSPDCSAKSCIRETESASGTTFTSAAQQWVMACDGENSLVQTAARGGTLHQPESTTELTVLARTEPSQKKKKIRALKCQQGAVMPLTTQTLYSLHSTFFYIIAEKISSLSLINPEYLKIDAQYCI